MCDKILYGLDDNILFRTCSLVEKTAVRYGDCTNFNTQSDFNGKDFYSCNQHGIHYHCAKHREFEMEFIEGKDTTFISCPKCRKKIDIISPYHLRTRCLKALNREIFKDAKLVRVNDWYVHEIPKVKVKPDTNPDYRIITDVKTDRDGDTIVVIYVTHEGTDGKAQLFIKPEKLQLSHDFKDLDPAKVLSKIELTLRDRTITQEYDD